MSENYNPLPPMYPPKPTNGFTLAALILGGMALLSLFLLFPPLFIAPLGILLGILSRGGDKKIPIPGKIGIAMCAIAVALSLSLTTVIVTRYLPQMNWEAFEEYMAKSATGNLSPEDINEFIENFYDNGGE